MKVADLLARRRDEWNELEKQTRQLGRAWKRPSPKQLLRFAHLYRSACADLALAQAYRLPEEMVHYLHQLVGNAHNILYRSERFQFQRWGRILFVDVPARLFRDPFLRLSTVIFWGAFFICGFLAYVQEGFAERVVGPVTLLQMEDMYSKPIEGRSEGADALMAGFYIQHNTGIGLRCFAMGVLFGVGSLYELTFNAIILGTIFGYMTGTPVSGNFYNFVTAHGPFELTAVVLSGAAGLRLGFGLISTNGLTRRASLVRSARQAVEVVGVAAFLFVAAAFIEGYVSPSALPYPAKAGVAILTTALLLFYFVGLGIRGRLQGAA